VGDLKLSPAQIDQLWAAGQTLQQSMSLEYEPSSEPLHTSGECDPGVVLWFRKQVSLSLVITL